MTGFVFTLNHLQGRCKDISHHKVDRNTIFSFSRTSCAIHQIKLLFIPLLCWETVCSWNELQSYCHYHLTTANLLLSVDLFGPSHSDCLCVGQLGWHKTQTLLCVLYTCLAACNIHTCAPELAHTHACTHTFQYPCWPSIFCSLIAHTCPPDLLYVMQLHFVIDREICWDMEKEVSVIYDSHSNVCFLRGAVGHASEPGLTSW